MRLELGGFYVTDVRFGPRTAIEDTVLLIDREELTSILQQEPLFDRIDVEVAHPGESCRITGVLDVLQPRCKLAAANFPGALAPFALVAAGPTPAQRDGWRGDTS